MLAKVTFAPAYYLTDTQELIVMWAQRRKPRLKPAWWKTAGVLFVCVSVGCLCVCVCVGVCVCVCLAGEGDV